ncbi:MAG: 1-acyl-sn-glycerol-3-phosphate acyltransferase [Flavobacterium sp.]|jgi:1-acyl-sn-glycerol-3-phosphate acyltransferase
MTPSKLKIAISFLTLMVWTVFIIISYGTLKFFKYAKRDDVVQLFHRGILKCFNIECVTKGNLHQDVPTLYVSNHISYLDIFVLGSKVPGKYIAKAEVAKWPLFGFLAKLQDTLFIERRGRKVGSQIEQIQQHLLKGNNLVLFPEGTSNIGTFVAPFHSSFFQSADHKEITIQPITVVYTHYKDQMMDRQQRDFYAWYKPRKILSHFINGLGLGQGRANLIFHTPVKLHEFESRKACSFHCENEIRKGLLTALELENEIKPD